MYLTPNVQWFIVPFICLRVAPPLHKLYHEQTVGFLCDDGRRTEKKIEETKDIMRNRWYAR